MAWWLLWILWSCCVVCAFFFFTRQVVANSVCVYVFFFLAMHFYSMLIRADSVWLVFFFYLCRIFLRLDWLIFCETMGWIVDFLFRFVIAHHADCMMSAAWGIHYRSGNEHCVLPTLTSYNQTHTQTNWIF